MRTFVAVFSHFVYGGEKDKWLIAFYGYGQSHSVYAKLHNKIKDTHNILVIDNPMWDFKEAVSPKDFQLYMNDLLIEKEISKFHSVSYSMGSRLNLYLPLFFENALDKIILVAPDGINFNFWNRLAVNTPWGRRIFKFLVDHGNVYLKILLVFHKIGFVNKSMYAFSKWNMRDGQRRRNVYNAWMNMRVLRPKLKLVNEKIEQHGIELISFFGKNDPVIPIAVQQRCVNYFPEQQHYLVDSDHNIMNDEVFEKIAKAIQP